MVKGSKRKHVGEEKQPAEAQAQPKQQQAPKGESDVSQHHAKKGKKAKGSEIDDIFGKKEAVKQDKQEGHTNKQEKGPGHSNKQAAGGSEHAEGREAAKVSRVGWKLLQFPVLEL
jgi:hypothetical protein